MKKITSINHSYKRVNITLPQATLRLIENIAKKGSRSRLIDEAVCYYVHEKTRVNLKKELREGARARASRDVKLAEEWFSLEQEANR